MKRAGAAPEILTVRQALPDALDMIELEVPSQGVIAKTRAKITTTLAVIGAGAGIVAGVVLTYLGNVISGYPITPPLEIYMWHAGIFGIIGALVGPPLVWESMRSVPLWRALLEPAAAVLLGGVIAMLISAPGLFIPFVVGGGIAAVWRLKRRYPSQETSVLEHQRVESATEGSS